MDAIEIRSTPSRGVRSRPISSKTPELRWQVTCLAFRLQLDLLCWMNVNGEDYSIRVLSTGTTLHMFINTSRIAACC